MIKNISIGIDVGSSKTRVLVGEFQGGEKNPKVIGLGESETGGLRHGYVVDSALAIKSVKQAVAQAENSSGIKIKRAFVSVSGTTLRSEISSGVAIISKADGEVTNLDLNKALQDCEDNLSLNNRKVIQSFPIAFRLDGKEVLGRLEGMRGTKLEIKALFITCSMLHLDDLVSVIAQAGVETIDVVASPIALADIVLSTKQKIVGAALANLGAESLSLTIFENGLPISVQSFLIGSCDITNDIALGFKIPLDLAESFKLGNIADGYSKKKLDEIIEARLSDIFELIENHLKKIKRSELLPAGIVFVGGGANIGNLAELSKAALKLPSSIGGAEILGNTKTKLRDPAWFTVLGLITYCRENGNYDNSSFSGFFKELKSSIKSGIKQLMP